MAIDRELRPEDQERVDKFISEGINSVERKPFRPLRLLLIIVIFVTGLSVLSMVLARYAGTV